MIEITDHISISEDEIVERFVRASEPGGQNVKTFLPFAAKSRPSEVRTILR